MDTKKRKARFAQIQKEIAKDINPIFKRLINKQDTLRDSLTEIDYTEWNPPCGIFEHAPTLSEEQKKEADDITDVIETEILEDPDELEEIRGMAAAASQKGEAGTGKGDGRGFVKLRKIKFPKWLKNIKTSLKDFFDISVKRKGIDWEEAIKNTIVKPKAKLINKEDSLYVFIDTSGSMWSYTDRNGVGLLELFASYFPKIAEEYNGQIWFADYAKYNDPEPIERTVDLSTLKKKDFDADKFAMGGYGGTQFWGVWQYYDKKVRETQKDNPKAKSMLIFFSDMEADFSTHPELILDKDVIFVTVEGKGQPLMKTQGIVDGKRRRLIFADSVKANN